VARSSRVRSVGASGPRGTPAKDAAACTRTKRSGSAVAASSARTVAGVGWASSPAAALLRTSGDGSRSAARITGHLRGSSQAPSRRTSEFRYTSSPSVRET